MTCRIFISNELYYLNNNIANCLGGMTLTTTLGEILYPPKEDTRTADEVIEHIKEKMRKL